jgi:hypothetical protein
MRAQLDVMREVFEEWLRIHKINYDFWFYTPAEWAVSAASLQAILDGLTRDPIDVPPGGRPEQREQLEFNARYGALCEKLYLMLKTHGHPEDRSEARTRGRL